ncbi:MAG: hypothetical protein GY793_08915 [Proteobacteria bacterium]|nr:hypothetical protein [Pseudomonadota bacterium]
MISLKNILYALIVFTCLMPFLQANAGEEENWHVTLNGDIVRYVTKGTAIVGHQFGFIKKTNNCERDILWVSLSTRYMSAKEEEIVGDATLRITAGGVSFDIETDVVTMFRQSNILKLVPFTNFLAGEKFLRLLESNKEITIEVVSPKKLVKLLDIKSEIFYLHGFSAAREEAHMVCANR